MHYGILETTHRKESMNVVKLNAEQKRAIHSAICEGKGIGGAAEAARIDRRTLDKLVNGEGGDDFLLGLVPPESITREEWEAATWDWYLRGERRTAAALRGLYVELLRKAHGTAIDDRLATEEEREEKARQIADEKAAKAEEERKKRAEAALERQMKADDERRAELARVYGEGYRETDKVLNAYEVLFGTEDEYRAGLGGVEKTAEREARRASSPWLLGSLYIRSDSWRRNGASMKKTARERVRTVENFRVRYAADVEKAGLAGDSKC